MPNLRKSNTRVRVSVAGPKVNGVVCPCDVEAYLFRTGWIAVFAHDVPAEAAPWYEARPRSWWETQWPVELPIGYDRENAGVTLPSPYLKGVRIGAILDMIGKAERRPPSDVLAHITRGRT